MRVLISRIEVDVDSDSWEQIKTWSWRTCRFYKKLYVVGRKPGKRRSYLLHRVVLGITDTKQHIDHIDGNPLNNTRVNLRLATVQQNTANRGPNSNNTTGFKGVYKTKNSKKWFAQIQIAGVFHRLGIFVTPEDAARAYDQKALECLGEFAYQNFPKEA